jgi:hypothetical protein
VIEDKDSSSIQPSKRKKQQVSLTRTPNDHDETPLAESSTSFSLLNDQTIKQGIKILKKGITHEHADEPPES